MTEEKLKSPRLQSLRQAIERGDETALDRFWRQMAAGGAPLIEPDEENANFSLVTFLWRGAAETKRVGVRVPVDGSGQDEHGMSRLRDTDLWYVTFRLRNDYRATYKFIVTRSLTSGQTVEKPDPLNPKTFIEPKDEERPDHTEDDIDSVVELPAAPPHPWTAPHPETAGGNLERRLFRSQILGNERRIWVYTPPAYKTSGDPYGLLLVLDGRFFTFTIGAPTILDNLLVENRIPPLVAVMIDNPGDTWRQSMATRERELSCYPPFSEFLAQEMAPWLRQNYHVAPDPAQTILAGGSNGALAAAFTALQRPDTVGNVIALSGSFWWKPEDDGEWEWLTRQFALGQRRDVRFYIEVGLLESKPTATGFPGQLLSNRHLRNVLQAKGYEVHYDEQMHGHDSMPWQGALGEGLIALTGTN